MGKNLRLDCIRAAMATFTSAEFFLKLPFDELFEIFAEIKKTQENG